jgi:hypothetical protein
MVPFPSVLGVIDAFVPAVMIACLKTMKCRFATKISNCICNKNVVDCYEWTETKNDKLLLTAYALSLKG